MKMICGILAIVLLAITAVSAPASVIYCLYLWGGEDYEFKVAAWEAAKNWFMMALCVIPGLALYGASQL